MLARPLSTEPTLFAARPAVVVTAVPLDYDDDQCTCLGANDENDSTAATTAQSPQNVVELRSLSTATVDGLSGMCVKIISMIDVAAKSLFYLILILQDLDDDCRSSAAFTDSLGPAKTDLSGYDDRDMADSPDDVAPNAVSVVIDVVILKLLIFSTANLVCLGTFKSTLWFPWQRFLCSASLGHATCRFYCGRSCCSFRCFGLADGHYHKVFLDACKVSASELIVATCDLIFFVATGRHVLQLLLPWILLHLPLLFSPNKKFAFTIC